MKPTLVIFIDALSYESRKIVLDQIKIFKEDIRLIPEIGYSSNQHWSIFAAKLPDELDYFTDYNLVCDASKITIGAYLRHSNILNTIINYISNKIGKRTSNVPLGLKKIFVNRSVYPLADKNNFSTLDPIWRSFELYRINRPEEMEMLDELCRQKMSEKSFIVINTLDHAGHMKIPFSNDYNDVLTRIMAKIKGVVDAFLLQYGKDSNVILLSDHGMSPVDSYINLIMEKDFGPQSTDSYIYFLDATLCRIWTFSDQIKKQLYEYMSNKEYGRIISDEEREYYGIKKRLFGDMIFILNSGCIFKPNYFGYGLKREVKGMHGYMPSEKMQHGLFMSNIPKEKEQESLRNVDVMNTIRNRLL